MDPGVLKCVCVVCVSAVAVAVAVAVWLWLWLLGCRMLVTLVTLVGVAPRELGNALLALGIVPSQKAIQRYHMSSSASQRGSLDLPTVRLCCPGFYSHVAGPGPHVHACGCVWLCVAVCEQFLRVSMHKLDGLERTTSQIADVFKLFDEGNTGAAAVLLDACLCVGQ